VRLVKPVLVGQFEFIEWTGDNDLRHSKFVGRREDKKPKDRDANEPAERL
jgi:bifunctional non-homologous end joining protein LigD